MGWWEDTKKKIRDTAGEGTFGDILDTASDINKEGIINTAESGASTLLTNLENTHDSFEAITDSGKNFLENQTNINETIRQGPGGSYAEVANAVYGGSFKDAVESTQNFYRDFEGGARYYAERTSLKPYLRSEDNLTDPEAELSGEGEGDITPEERETLLVQGLAGGRGSTTPGGSTGYRGRKQHQNPGNATILAPSTGLV